MELSLSSVGFWWQSSKTNHLHIYLLPLLWFVCRGGDAQGLLPVLCLGAVQVRLDQRWSGITLGSLELNPVTRLSGLIFVFFCRLLLWVAKDL